MEPVVLFVYIQRQLQRVVYYSYTYGMTFTTYFF